MASVVFSLRMDSEVHDKLKAQAGNASAYVGALIADALARGVVVTTSGHVIQPPQGDMFAKSGKTTTRKGVAR